MRLNIIVISTIAVAFLSACGQQAPVTSEQTASTTTREPVLNLKGDDSVLPSEQVEKELFDREKRKSGEDKDRKQFNEKVVTKLNAKAQAAADAKDTPEQVRILIELGKFYRTKRRQHDTLDSFARALAAAETLPETHPLYAESLIELGEAQLRLNELDAAMHQFEAAEKALPAAGPNQLGESRPKMQERMAWVYRCQGDAAQAKKLLKKAKDTVLKQQGKDSSAYRIALIEETIFAMDNQEGKAVQALSKEISTLKTKPDGFGKVFLRICARNCRKSGQIDQEDFLEEQSEFFADYEKAHKGTL